MNHFIILDLDFKWIKNSRPTMRFTIGDYLIDDLEITSNRIYKLYEVSDEVIRLGKGDFKIALTGITSNYTNGFVTKSSWSRLNKFYIIPDYIFKTDFNKSKKYKFLKEKVDYTHKTKRQYSVKNYKNKDNSIDLKKFLKMYTGGYNLIQNQIVNCSFTKNINGKFYPHFVKSDLFQSQKTYKEEDKGGRQAIIKFQPVKITSPGYYQLSCKQKHKVWAGYPEYYNGGMWGKIFGYPDRLFDDILDSRFNEDFLYDIQTKYTQDENQRNYN
jgi:hypothetical protein